MDIAWALQPGLLCVSLWRRHAIRSLTQGAKDCVSEETCTFYSHSVSERKKIEKHFQTNLAPGTDNLDLRWRTRVQREKEKERKQRKRRLEEGYILLSLPSTSEFLIHKRTSS